MSTSENDDPEFTEEEEENIVLPTPPVEEEEEENIVLPTPVEEEEENIVLPTQIMKIAQKYTSWETMEDIYKDLEMYENERRYSKTCGLIIGDVENLLERMEKLHSDLKDYDVDCKNSLHDVVEITKHQIFDKFQGVQNKEAHNELDDNYWVDAILLERRSVNHRVGDECYCCDCWRGWPRFSLASLAYDLCMISRTVCWKVNDIIGELKLIVVDIHYQMESEKRQIELEKEKCERDRILREKEEARRLMDEKLQCLCNVMKEVLGDRVDEVVFSHCGYFPNSSCILKDSEGMGGKIMEIKPNDYLIEDLRKRVDADKNDIHVRNATLLLFNHAELYWKTKIHEGDNACSGWEM